MAKRILWLNPDHEDVDAEISACLEEGFVEVWRAESRYGMTVMFESGPGRVDEAKNGS